MRVSGHATPTPRLPRRCHHSTEGFKRTYLDLWLDAVRKIGYTETGVFLLLLSPESRFVGFHPSWSPRSKNCRS